MYKAEPWTMMKADISRLVPTITRFVQRINEDMYV